MKFLIAVFLLPSLCWAHGENKPGPHGGHIRMPGAFHTELVLEEDQSLSIYLLDMNFESPQIKDSNVEVFLKSKKGEKIPFKCMPMNEDHFHCMPEKKFSLKGELKIKAVRNKAAGNEAVYKLPLPPLNGEQQDAPVHHH